VAADFIRQAKHFTSWAVSSCPAFSLSKNFDLFPPSFILPSMKLFDQVREINLIEKINSLLSWDQETYLPANSADYRAKQLAYLATLAHKLSTSKSYLKALAKAEAKDKGKKPIHSANLRELRRISDRATKIPTELVARESSTQSAAHHAWIHARKQSDFSIFSPHLKDIVDIALQKADLWGYSDEPYSALLEGYERKTSTQSIADLFDTLRNRLAPISAAAVEKSKSLKPVLPSIIFPLSAQQDFNSVVAAEIGFDFRAGRIDTTAHPFCTGLGPQDIRITTRYNLQDFTSSLFGIMHEVGHALYEQGLPQDDFGLPSGTAVSLGIHESQSRLWENQVGRSPAFWKKFYPIAIQYFPQLEEFSLEKFMHFIHRTELSEIRVEADEATYDLHIILRFQIERMLLKKEISVKDVPATWNELFKKSFGFLPKDDAHGCLQDVHWSFGGIGYFPTYTLGNINAAQLFQTAISDPKIKSANENADYAPLLKWLRENVHQHGSTHDPVDLMKMATGRAPDTSDYLKHLSTRYI
jgi:carboxypeptidase Taq